MRRYQRNNHQRRRRAASGVAIAAAASAIFAMAAGLPSASPQQPAKRAMMQMPGMISLESPADSVAADSAALAPRRSQAEILSERAVADYKTLKHMQYEGDTPDNLYPVAMSVCEAAMQASGAEGADASIIEQMKGILADLHPMAGRAAVFYSSNGDSRNMARAAKVYVDAAILPQLADNPLQRDARLYPMLTYVAASDSYNSGDYPRALDYFELYMQSGDPAYRQSVALFMGQTALAVQAPQRAMKYVRQASDEYPADAKLLATAVQLSQATGNTEGLQAMLDRGLLQNPDDESLLKVQAALCESRYEFKRALDIWHILADKHPNSLTYNERLAQAYYNVAVGFYNESIMSQNEKEAKSLRRQSKSYFEAAIPRLEEILANLPTSVKYLKALGVAYGCLDLKDEFDRINSRLEALGNRPVTKNQMPGVITAEDSAAAPTFKSSDAESGGVPSFDKFARGYIEANLATWAQKGEFETVEDYSRRVSQGNGANTEYERLLTLAADEYLKKYASRMRISEMTLEPYDAGNQTFRVNTTYGPVVVAVPNKNREAEMFKANWDGVQIRNPRFLIKDDKVGLASITFQTPAGKTYSYDAAEAADYSVPRVKVDINSIIAAVPGAGVTSESTAAPTAYVGLKSDVDEKIPVTSKVNDNTFVLIIANEEYQKTMPVASAFHDGEMFRQYCIQTLGIPESRVLFYPNATLNAVYESLEILKSRVKGSGKTPDIIFYYAGHGLPDDDTKSAFMVPVDANPRLPKTWVPMKEVYQELTSIPSTGVMAFVDACFSGASRSGNKDDMLNETRGIALKPKAMLPTNNESLFVLTAASANETALPYKEKNHGLFTYFLLKKLQESKGNATLSELSKYVKTQVGAVSNSKFQKEQTPEVMTTGKMASEWEKKKLK